MDDREVFVSSCIGEGGRKGGWKSGLPLADFKEPIDVWMRAVRPSTSPDVLVDPGPDGTRGGSQGKTWPWRSGVPAWQHAYSVRLGPT